MITSKTKTIDPVHRSYLKRNSSFKLRRQNAERKRSVSPRAKTATVKRRSASRAQLRTIKAARAYIANALKDSMIKPLTRYEAGFQASLEEFGRLLDPRGYSNARPLPKLMAGLQKASASKSKATLQSVEAVRNYLYDSLMGATEDPSDNQFLYGYEDANRQLWRMVTPER